MEEVLTNKMLQESLKEKGKQRLTNFTWPRAGNELKEVFKTAANHGK
jgi:hypothetical protein